MENDRKKCTKKRWKADDPYLKQMSFLLQIERETEKETPENMTNEATRYACDFCGCDHCGQPILLRECSKCGSTLCGCHIMPEEHDCMLIEKGWDEYIKWKNALENVKIAY
jgi:predicted nucleic acid binding AN1-type Zn finger protein